MRIINLLFALCPIALFGQEAMPDFRAGLGELSRLGATKPFLKDSPDVYLEPESLNKFFTEKIYSRLEGNAYFGYRFDEGFTCNNNAEISIEPVKDLTGTAEAAYRLALEQALTSYQIKPDAGGKTTVDQTTVCQIGVCIVGIEATETAKTLPGVMIEAYLRNTSTRKSFFIRFGAGSPRGLSAAIRLSASMLAAELESRREQH